MRRFARVLPLEVALGQIVGLAEGRVYCIHLVLSQLDLVQKRGDHGLERLIERRRLILRLRGQVAALVTHEAVRVVQVPLLDRVVPNANKDV